MTPPRWEADTLGVASDASSDAALGAFLKTVAAEGFVPPERAVAAASNYAGVNLPLTADARAETAALIRPEVDAFAAAFWTLSPDNREARWTELTGRCRDGPSAAFLKHLGTACGLEVRRQSDGAADELADLARELFVLRDRPRAVRRAEWLADRGVEEDWQPAATALRWNDQAVADLDPLLLQAISLPATVSPPLTAAEAQRFTDRLVARDRPKKAAPREERTQPGILSNFSGWGWVGVLVFAGMLIRGCASIMRETKSLNNPPTYSPPPVYRPKFTDEQIRTFRAYDPKSGKPAPPDYAIWRLTQSDRKVPKP